ncbi:hypothetical protein B0H15DRAFT_799558 [Mycena belliarum]|uniref:Uncharacterized protein n=1 Tax=Mycena belliarum TaxID=1033014 RepID=A0AAD6U953_9AGAR|nr:hypothetical protein B0H15DRAFT_799558 [Mycena belliae]
MPAQLPASDVCQELKCRELLLNLPQPGRWSAMAALYLHNSFWRPDPDGPAANGQHHRTTSTATIQTLQFSDAGQPLLQESARETIAFLDLLARQPTHPNAPRADTALSFNGDPTTLRERKGAADDRLRRRLRRLKLGIVVLEGLMLAWSLYTGVRYFLTYAHTTSSPAPALALGAAATACPALLLGSAALPLLRRHLRAQHLSAHALLAARTALRSGAALLLLAPAAVNLALAAVYKRHTGAACTVDVDIVWNGDRCRAGTVALALAVVRVVVTLAVLTCYCLTLSAYRRTRRPSSSVHSHRSSSSFSFNFSSYSSSALARARSASVHESGPSSVTLLSRAHSGSGSGAGWGARDKSLSPSANGRSRESVGKGSTAGSGHLTGGVSAGSRRSLRSSRGSFSPSPALESVRLPRSASFSPPPGVVAGLGSRNRSDEAVGNGGGEGGREEFDPYAEAEGRGRSGGAGAAAAASRREREREKGEEVEADDVSGQAAREQDWELAGFVERFRALVSQVAKESVDGASLSSPPAASSSSSSSSPSSSSAGATSSSRPPSGAADPGYGRYGYTSNNPNYEFDSDDEDDDDGYAYRYDPYAHSTPGTYGADHVRILNSYIRRMPTIESMGSREVGSTLGGGSLRHSTSTSGWGGSMGGYAGSVAGSSVAGSASGYGGSRPPTRAGTLTMTPSSVGTGTEGSAGPSRAGSVDATGAGAYFPPLSPVIGTAGGGADVRRTGSTSSGSYFTGSPASQAPVSGAGVGVDVRRTGSTSSGSYFTGSPVGTPIREEAGEGAGGGGYDGGGGGQGGGQRTPVIPFGGSAPIVLLGSAGGSAPQTPTTSLDGFGFGADGGSAGSHTPTALGATPTPSVFGSNSPSTFGSTSTTPTPSAFGAATPSPGGLTPLAPVYAPRHGSPPTSPTRALPVPPALLPLASSPLAATVTTAGTPSPPPPTNTATPTSPTRALPMPPPRALPARPSLLRGKSA